MGLLFCLKHKDQASACGRAQIQDGHSPVPMAEDGWQTERLLNAGIREISLASTQLKMSY